MKVQNIQIDKNNFLAKSLEVSSQTLKRQDGLLQPCHAINNDGMVKCAITRPSLQCRIGKLVQ
jgi:hypothetical protein